MKTTFFATCFLTFSSVWLASGAFAKEPGKLILSDDFERNDSQELKDEVGNGWGTNSAKRAGGNKIAGSELVVWLAVEPPIS